MDRLKAENDHLQRHLEAEDILQKANIEEINDLSNAIQAQREANEKYLLGRLEMAQAESDRLKRQRDYLQIKLDKSS